MIEDFNKERQSFTCKQNEVEAGKEVMGLVGKP